MPPASPSAPAWRAFIHLYLPVLSSTLLVLFIRDPFQQRALLLASALPTYLLGSLFHQPRPRPLVRFTHRSHLHRAAVLFTYGRIFGTPFKPGYYICDLLFNYGVSALIDRPDDAPPRTSEFLVYALWTAASSLLFSFTPPAWPLLWSVAGAVDRTMFRAAYLALVDDVVRVLAYPNLATRTGTAVVVGVQALFISISVLAVRFAVAMSLAEPSDG